MAQQASFGVLAWQRGLEGWDGGRAVFQGWLDYRLLSLFCSPLPLPPFPRLLFRGTLINHTLAPGPHTEGWLQHLHPGGYSFAGRSGVSPNTYVMWTALSWRGEGVLGTQSGRPDGLAMVKTSLGKGHLGQALMEKGV